MEIILLLLGFVGCYIVATLIHELGHVVCGLCNRWKLFMLVVGPLKLYRETLDSPIKLGIEKNIVMWCGVGGTFPTTKSENNIKIWAKVLLAGPFTSIIFGLIMIPVFVVTKNIFVLMLCLMSIAMGAMCIIPMKMKTGLLYNDGTRYKRIRSGGQEELEEKAIFKLIEISMLEGEDATYPDDLIKPLLESKDNELKYYGYYYSYSNAKKAGNLDDCEYYKSKMEELKDKVPKVIIEDCPW